jgi:hypothetical protein
VSFHARLADENFAPTGYKGARTGHVSERPAAVPRRHILPRDDYTRIRERGDRGSGLLTVRRFVNDSIGSGRHTVRVEARTATPEPDPS